MYLLFGVVSGEALLGVRYFDAAIGATLHGAEDIGAGGSAREADIEAGAEGARAVVHVLYHEVLAIHLSLTRVDRVQVEFLEHLSFKSSASVTRAIKKGNM